MMSGAVRGAGKPRIPFWVKALAFAVPTAVVLLWVFWGQLVLALAPSLVPVLGPVLPRPEGAPGSAMASWDPELGVLWRDCRPAAGGHVSAEWWGDDGFHRAWISLEGGCERPAGDETPLALRLADRATPVLTLERLSATAEPARRRELCDAAATRGLGAYVRVARATNRREAGADLQRVLGGFIRAAPGLKWARPGGQVISSQLCNFRDHAPPKPGEVPNVISLDLSPG